MKKLLNSTILIACLFIGAFTANAYDFKSNGIYYNINSSDGTATVTRSDDGTHYTGNVTIPATVTHNGTTYNVTGIDSWAFNGNSELSSISIGNKVRTIGYHAFDGCTLLTSVVIPNSTETMGEGAFLGCTSLKNLTIGNTLKEVSNSAFEGCTSLISVTIPGNVETIGTSAFNGCNHLSDLTINEGVVNINSSAFRDCSILPAVRIPNTVKTIGSWAFLNCVEIETLTLGYSVNTIGYAAFSGCNAIKTINSCNETAPVMDNANCFTVYTTANLFIPIGSSTSYDNTNYWKNFTSITEKDMGNTGKPKIGDVDGDGQVSIADVGALIDIILKN